MSSLDWVDHEFLEELRGRGFLKATFLRLDDERRNQVLDAVLAESARLGPERVNIKEVARLAGVPVGSLYQYFGDREALSRFATLVVSRKLSRDLIACVPYVEAISLREALASFITTGIEWSVQEAASLRSFVAAAYGGVPRSWANPSGSGDDWYVESLVRPVAQAMQELVRRAMMAAETRGELKEGLDAEAAAKLANVLLIAVGDARMMPRLDEYYLLYNRGSGSEAVFAAAVDFICRSVLREDSGPQLPPSPPPVS
jgi:AcrR family transcriptional regulator